MATRNRKNRKRRGHVQVGYGRVGKHRKHPGGRGNAGGQHHHRTWFDRYHPGFFGKVGMRQFHKNRFNNWKPAVNVDSLWSLAGEKAYQEAKERKDGKALVVDIRDRGYAKVIGRGKLPKIPLVVRARFFSKSAERKIKAAGGVCIPRA